MLRICVFPDIKNGYRAEERRLRQQWDALLPVFKDNNVTLGVQNHYGNSITTAVAIMHLIEDYDPKCIGAVLDPAHCGLAGEPEAMAIDIVWSHLLLVNLKSAFWRRTTGPEAEDVMWAPYWTNGRQGLVSWPAVANELKRRGYKGDICLPAEYSNRYQTDQLWGDDAAKIISQDIKYARSLF